MKALVIGVGGFGRAVAEAQTMMPQAQLSALSTTVFPELRFVDEWPVLGQLRELGGFRAASDTATLAIGNNRVRADTFARAVEAGFALPALAHPGAWVSPSARRGRGVIVMAGASIEGGAILGPGAVASAGSVVSRTRN